MGKRILWTLVAVLSFCGNILAQTDVKLDDDAMYFTKDELPNAVKFLPAPPDTTSVAFNYDILQYMWGKEQRQDSLRTLWNGALKREDSCDLPCGASWRLQCPLSCLKA